MNFKYGELNDSRLKELQEMSNLNDDIPQKYQPWVTPIRIKSSYVKTDDEFYIIDQLSPRAQEEMELKDSTFLLIMGKEHIYFDAYCERVEYHENPPYRKMKIYVRENEKLKLYSHTENFLDVIKESLTAYKQPKFEVEKFGYTYCDVIFEGMEIQGSAP
ncbi:MAG: hypothetical protein J5476_13025 [Lachnospiraceae bacterium]|nr:hypothetical protein [Lachnospiraceae bacterium]